MAEAATLPLPYPDVATVAQDSLAEQSFAVAVELPERPVVLGGCCCAHVGAVEGLAARNGRVAVVWVDAHGDLNEPASSPSGALWGMPLRMLIDAGIVADEDVALVGVRNLDPTEEDFLARHDVHLGAGGVDAALAGADGVYVAFDGDSVEPDELAVFMPEPGGLSLADVERLLEDVRARSRVFGAGVTGLVHEPRNVEPVTRLCAALGL